MPVIRPGGAVHVGGRSFTREELALHALQSRIEDGQLPADPDQVRRLKPTRKLRRESEQARLMQTIKLLKDAGLPSLVPLLPVLFYHNGEPYHLNDHFPFEPMFNTRLPQSRVLKTGRQVSKSTTLATEGIGRSITIPYHNTLYVTPLFETIRRFSTNYVRAFIDQSPVRALMVDHSCNHSVLQRTFLNQSTMHFSYAFLDANRVRGINASAVSIDEVQDMDPEHLPVIMETMSASRWGIKSYAGTPKTLAGPLERRWQESSQAQWHIWCEACGKENIPSLEYDLDAMTGPSLVDRDVSEASPGVICAKCQRPIFPRKGGWVHHYPDRRPKFSGYHVPQIIMPMHYADPIKWATLIGKRDTEQPYSYYNEVCGESYDAGARLITQTELRRACTKHPNTLEHARTRIYDYPYRVLSIDWGGGGQDQISFTVAAAMGMLPDGRIDTIFGERLRITHNYAFEARRLMYLANELRCHYIVHDFTGAGAIREHLMVNAGLPLSMLIPISYIRAARGPIMRFIDENPNTQQRAHHQVDKARMLVLTCELIRHKQLQFFEYDGQEGQPGLVDDFLSLTEDRVMSRVGMDVFTVIRDELSGPDDFAQAVNIGAAALFHIRGQWPDLAKLVKFELDPRLIASLAPQDPNWGVD